MNEIGLLIYFFYSMSFSYSLKSTCVCGLKHFLNLIDFIYFHYIIIYFKENIKFQ